MGWTNQARLKAFAARRIKDAPIARRGVDTNLCARGLHDLSGDNIGWHKRTGRSDRYCLTCDRATRRRRHKNNPDKFRAYFRARSKRRVMEARKKVFAAYGNKCSCCGEMIEKFLTLEHVQGYGGAKVNGRRSWKTMGFPMYRQVIGEGFPKDKYALLCMNCNWAERWGEPCPHKRLIN